jgi:drug/metabolite transporter (DMT)-like permease
LILVLGFILALLSAAASGISVVIVRKHSAGSSVFNISLVITAVGLVVLWPLALAESSFNLITPIGFILFAVSGLLSPGLVRLFYYKGLKTLGTSVNSSVFAVYPLYSSLLAVVLLNEIVTGWNALGIVTIVVGVILVERSMNGRNVSEHVSWKGFIVPVLGGLMLGVATIFRKFALQESNSPVLGVAIAYVFSLLPYLLVLVTYAPVQRELSLKKGLRWFWVAGVGQAVTWLLAFYALSLEQVSITTPLLSLEPLFVVAFAYLYLKELEHISTRLVASIGITILGVVLIAL